MRKTFIALIISLFALFIPAAKVSADTSVAEASASLKISNSNSDYRVRKLRAFLAKHNSPLTDYADEFIATADKYNIDWRLVPAIAGVESTFGKRIPYNSYNAYGWANGDYSFKSWEDSIEIVTRTLRENYINRGATSIGRIARIYAPPSSTWAGKVRFFMRKIEAFPVTFTLEG